jgi:hypothetical protein
MRAKSQRRRPRGSLVSVQKALWAVIHYNWTVVEDDALDHDIRQKASTSLVQAALGWARLAELTDLEAQMRRFEQLTQGNGHRS